MTVKEFENISLEASKYINNNKISHYYEDQPENHNQLEDQDQFIEEAEIQSHLMKKFHNETLSTYLSTFYVPVPYYKNKIGDSSSHLAIAHIIATSDQKFLLQIYDMSGEMHEELLLDCAYSLYAASPQQEDSFISLFNPNGQVKMIQVSVNKIRANQKIDEATNSPAIPKYNYRLFFNLSTTVDLQENLNFANFSNMMISITRNQKLLMFSDTNGFIHNFYINGSFKNSYAVDTTPIISFLRSSSHFLAASSKTIQIIASSGSGQLMTCDFTGSDFIQVLPDTHTPNFMYALTKNNNILIFYFSKTCNMIHKFSLKPFMNSKQYNIPIMYSIKHYLLVQLGKGSNNFVSFRVSEFESELMLSSVRGFSINLFDMVEDEILQLNIHINTQLSNFIYVTHKNSSSTFLKTTLFEFTMPLKSENDYFDNIRILVIIGSVIIAFIFNIWMREKRRKNSLKNQKPDKPDLKKNRLEKLESIEKTLSGYTKQIDNLYQKTSKLDGFNLSDLQKQTENLENIIKNRVPEHLKKNNYEF